MRRTRASPYAPSPDPALRSWVSSFRYACPLYRAVRRLEGHLSHASPTPGRAVTLNATHAGRADALAENRLLPPVHFAIVSRGPPGDGPLHREAVHLQVLPGRGPEAGPEGG